MTVRLGTAGFLRRRLPDGRHPRGDGINGGIGRSKTGAPRSTFYVETGDLPATLDKANSLGGSTVMPVTGFGGVVTMAMFNDPDGLLVGLVRAAAEPGQGGGPAPSGSRAGPVLESKASNFYWETSIYNRPRLVAPL